MPKKQASFDDYWNQDSEQYYKWINEKLKEASEEDRCDNCHKKLSSFPYRKEVSKDGNSSQNDE